MRNGFTAYAVLSSATNSSCHRRQRIDGLPRLSPVGPACLRGLGASNGRQDHTVLPYATRLRQEASVCVHIHRSFNENRSIAARLRAVIRSRAQSPPCDYVCAPGAAASTASRPNVRDDGQRPSEWDGMANHIA